MSMRQKLCRCCGANYAEAFRVDNYHGDGVLSVVRYGWSQGRGYNHEFTRRIWQVDVSAIERADETTQAPPPIEDDSVYFTRMSDGGTDVLWVYEDACYIRIDVSDPAAPELLTATYAEDADPERGVSEVYAPDWGELDLHRLRACWGPSWIVFCHPAPAEPNHGTNLVRWVDPVNFAFREDATIGLDDTGSGVTSQSETGDYSYEIVGITRNQWPCRLVVKKIEVLSHVSASGSSTKFVNAVQVDVGTIELPTDAPTTYPFEADVDDFESAFTRNYTNYLAGGSDSQKQDGATAVANAADKLTVYDFDVLDDAEHYAILAADDGALYPRGSTYVGPGPGDPGYRAECDPEALEYDPFATDCPIYEFLHDDYNTEWRVNYAWAGDGTYKGYRDEDPSDPDNFSFSHDDHDEYRAIWPHAGGHGAALPRGKNNAIDPPPPTVLDRVDLSSGSVSKTINTDAPLHDFLRYRITYAYCKTTPGGADSVRLYAFLNGRAPVYAETAFVRADEWRIERPAGAGSESWRAIQAPWGDSDDGDNDYVLPPFQVGGWAAAYITPWSHGQSDQPTIYGNRGLIGDVSTVAGDPFVPPHDWVYAWNRPEIIRVGYDASSDAGQEHTLTWPADLRSGDLVLLVLMSTDNDFESVLLESTLPAYTWQPQMAAAIGDDAVAVYSTSGDGADAGFTFDVALKGSGATAAVVVVYRGAVDALEVSTVFDEVNATPAHPQTVDVPTLQESNTFLVHGCLALGSGGDWDAVGPGDELLLTEGSAAPGTSPNKLCAAVIERAIEERGDLDDVTYSHEDEGERIAFCLAVKRAEY